MVLVAQCSSLDLYKSTHAPHLFFLPSCSNIISSDRRGIETKLCGTAFYNIHQDPRGSGHKGRQDADHHVPYIDVHRCFGALSAIEEEPASVDGEGGSVVHANHGNGAALPCNLSQSTLSTSRPLPHAQAGEGPLQEAHRGRGVQVVGRGTLLSLFLSLLRTPLIFHMLMMSVQLSLVGVSDALSHNWLDEVKKHAPNLRIVFFTRAIGAIRE